MSIQSHYRFLARLFAEYIAANMKTLVQTSLEGVMLLPKWYFKAILSQGMIDMPHDDLLKVVQQWGARLLKHPMLEPSVKAQYPTVDSLIVDLLPPHTLFCASIRAATNESELEKYYPWPPDWAFQIKSM